MNKGVNYSMFYDILLNLREEFHSYGRIDDSNAKLDEMIKLICTSYSMALSGMQFSLEHIRQVALSHFGNQDMVAAALRYVCENEMQKELFRNADGTNIFGSNPSLAIQPTENDFAQKLIIEIEKIDFVYLIQNRSYSDFDLVNECFGHFVRDNFRNNKEDAQYMTPYEISKAILDIIFDDMQRQQYFDEHTLRTFTVMDPTCGVGTLLIESSSHFTKYVENNIHDENKRTEIIGQFRLTGILGQDKVDRMVRLSKINALLLGSNASNISEGNSIVGHSNLNQYIGAVDLIFTNPPFGAEYSIQDLELSEFPILSNAKPTAKILSSELLMLDKCINILKPGGYLAIVLPDSVFASKGIYSIYRDSLMKEYNILGVIGLPTVTFAQAGTRTNTCVLILRKMKPDVTGKMFMADCKDIGYIVKERAGVPIKIEQGTNEMVSIAKSIIDSTNSSTKILSESPSVTMIDSSDYVGNNLKPSFYAAERFKTIKNLRNSVAEGFRIAKLGDIVEFTAKSRKSYMVSDTIKHISVLHINADCTIAFDEVEKFNPVSKGRKCYPEELIFSKINPRIPRMAVIPFRNTDLVCSNEFEIMRSRGVIGMYALCFLLKTKNVMSQIENLTSGTSSSHNRIKREQLADILIPIPVSEEAKKLVAEVDRELEAAVKLIYTAESKISDKFAVLNNI